MRRKSKSFLTPFTIIFLGLKTGVGKFSLQIKFNSNTPQAKLH